VTTAAAPGDRRVALVSGGGRGIGRAVSLALGAAGFDVAVNYRRDGDAAAATVDEIVALGVAARGYQAAVDDADQVAVMVAAVAADFGRVDALVHCAGNASRGHFVVDTDPSEPMRLFGVHAAGAHHLCRLTVPYMRQQGRGDVVLVSSIVADEPRPGMAPYVMAKAALEILGRTLAMEERANGIRVNVVAPGLVATEMGDRLIRATQGRDRAADLDAVAPFGRVCRPEDIAAAVAFLMSDAGGYITGQRLAVDGGESWGWWGPAPGKDEPHQPDQAQTRRMEQP
jgi:NAD(P)-dependent dehydrogenase (short-subunit alcohol dehydrogenase family)